MAFLGWYGVAFTVFYLGLVGVTVLRARQGNEKARSEIRIVPFALAVAVMFLAGSLPYVLDWHGGLRASAQVIQLVALIAGLVIGIRSGAFADFFRRLRRSR